MICINCYTFSSSVTLQIKPTSETRTQCKLRLSIKHNILAVYLESSKTKGWQFLIHYFTFSTFLFTSPLHTRVIKITNTFKSLFHIINPCIALESVNPPTAVLMVERKGFPVLNIAPALLSYDFQYSTIKAGSLALKSISQYQL